MAREVVAPMSVQPAQAFGAQRFAQCGQQLEASCEAGVGDLPWPERYQGRQVLLAHVGAGGGREGRLSKFMTCHWKPRLCGFRSFGSRCTGGDKIRLRSYPRCSLFK